jgi:hypothetical protein
MDSSIPGMDVGMAYAVRVQQMTQNQARADGKAALQLIEQASAPPPGLEGQGTHVNTYG